MLQKGTISVLALTIHATGPTVWLGASRFVISLLWKRSGDTLNESFSLYDLQQSLVTALSLAVPPDLLSIRFKAPHDRCLRSRLWEPIQSIQRCWSASTPINEEMSSFRFCFQSSPMRSPSLYSLHFPRASACTSRDDALAHYLSSLASSDLAELDALTKNLHPDRCSWSNRRPVWSGAICEHIVYRIGILPWSSRYNILHCSRGRAAPVRAKSTGSCWASRYHNFALSFSFRICLSSTRSWCCEWIHALSEAEKLSEQVLMWKEWYGWIKLLPGSHISLTVIGINAEKKQNKNAEHPAWKKFPRSLNGEMHHTGYQAYFIYLINLGASVFSLATLPMASYYPVASISLLS